MLWIYPYLLPRDCNMHSRSYLISWDSCCYTSHIPLAGLMHACSKRELSFTAEDSSYILHSLNRNCFEMSSWGDRFHTPQITRSLTHLRTFRRVVFVRSCLFRAYSRWAATLGPSSLRRACNESRWKLPLWFTSSVRLGSDDSVAWRAAGEWWHSHSLSLSLIHKK